MGDMADYHSEGCEEIARRWTSESRTWKCRDGALIPFEDLSDTHLMNILKMLVRKNKTDEGQYPTLKAMAVQRGLVKES